MHNFQNVQSSSASTTISKYPNDSQNNFEKPISASTLPETRKLQQDSYHQADIWMHLHHLMVTSLLQVVNRLAASCELYAGFMQVVSSTCSKSANYQVATSLMFKDLMQLNEVNRLDTTCWQLSPGLLCSGLIGLIETERGCEFVGSWAPGGIDKIWLYLFPITTYQVGDLSLSCILV